MYVCMYNVCLSFVSFEIGARPTNTQMMHHLHLGRRRLPAAAGAASDGAVGVPPSHSAVLARAGHSPAQPQGAVSMRNHGAWFLSHAQTHTRTHTHTHELTRTGQRDEPGGAPGRRHRRPARRRRPGGVRDQVT